MTKLVLLFALAELAAAGPAKTYRLEELLEDPAVQGRPAGVHRLETYLTQGMIRRDDLTAGTTTLIATEPPSISVLNHADQTYFVLEGSALAALEAYGTALMTRFSPDAGGPAGVTRAAEPRRVGAWTCRDAIVHDRPLKGSTTRLCLSEEIAIEPELVEQLRSGGAALESSPLASLESELRALPGYPVELSTELLIDGVRYGMSQRLVSYEVVASDAQRFAVPAGYARVPSPFAPRAEPAP